jgi:hypothetical protein
MDFLDCCSGARRKIQDGDECMDSTIILLACLAVAVAIGGTWLTIRLMNRKKGGNTS